MDSATVIDKPESNSVSTPPDSANSGFDWRAIFGSKLFLPALLALTGIGILFWYQISRLPKLWLSEDGYYSHGFLVPFIAGYVVYRKWDQIKSIPIKPGWLALPFIAMFGYVAYVSTHMNISATLAVAFLATLMASIWLVAGWRWMLALALPVLYLGFALPLWTSAIEFNTNRAQVASTSVAYQLLNAFGLDPHRAPVDQTVIYLDHFKLDVAVPCSGLKLMLAVTAFTAFFMMIGGLKWWGNLAMAAIILPLCVLINGLRIALIGMVGNTYGEAAGYQFHDWSGYITLGVCFFLLFKIARGLGWKD